MSSAEPSQSVAPPSNAAAVGARSVFVSYASQDAALADQVCAALEAGGFPCWIAPRDVRPGAPYAAAIVEAINACRLARTPLALAERIVGGARDLKHRPDP
jgi:hypothetical protein